MPAAARSRSRNNSGNSRQPPALPLRDRVAARLQELAADAQCAEIAEGAGDPEIAGETVYGLLAHQLAAGHALTMSLGAHAGRLVREAQAGAGGEEDGGRRSQEMLRFVAGTARLMERCRSAALALDRIGFPEVPPAVPDGPGDPMDGVIINGLSWKTIAARDKERRRLLDWLAQGKKLKELPKVEDWGEYHEPDMPDIEELDERLYPPMPQASCGSAAGHPAAPGLKRGRLKNGNPSGDYMTAPRCGAQTRAATGCRQPAMANGRCRFHGGKSTGPRTAEGLERARTARHRHGFRSAEIIELRSAAARGGRRLQRLTLTAHALRSTSQGNKHTPLPMKDRGQGERGLARGSAPKTQLTEIARPMASDMTSLPQEQGIGRRLMPRFRTETSLPYPSPPRGDGMILSIRSHRAEHRAARAAGHGVHRSNCSRATPAAGRTPAHRIRNLG